MEANQFVKLLKQVEPHVEKEGLIVDWRAVAELVTAPEFLQLIVKNNRRYTIQCYGREGWNPSTAHPYSYSLEEAIKIVGGQTQYRYVELA